MMQSKLLCHLHWTEPTFPVQEASSCTADAGSVGFRQHYRQSRLHHRYPLPLFVLLTCAKANKYITQYSKHWYYISLHRKVEYHEIATVLKIGNINYICMVPSSYIVQCMPDCNTTV